MHPDLLKRVEDLRRADLVRQAERWRLLCETGCGPSRWLPRPRYWLMRRLGRLLVTIGQRLERYELLDHSTAKAR